MISSSSPSIQKNHNVSSSMSDVAIPVQNLIVDQLPTIKHSTIKESNPSLRLSISNVANVISVQPPSLEELKQNIRALYSQYKRIVLSRHSRGITRIIARGNYDSKTYTILSRYRKRDPSVICLYNSCKAKSLRRHLVTATKNNKKTRLSIPKPLRPYNASQTFRYENFRDWSIDNEDMSSKIATSPFYPLEVLTRYETHRIEIGTESEWRRFAASTLGVHLEHNIWKKCFPLRRPWHKHMNWGDPLRFPLGHLCHIVILVACNSYQREIVGFCALEQRMKEPFEGDVFIHDVCILPEWRRSKRSESFASRVRTVFFFFFSCPRCPPLISPK